MYLKEKEFNLNFLLSNKNYIKLLFLFLLIILPWFILGVNSDLQPEKITSDLRFYEINTCEISIIDFLFENPNVIYQDHYKLRYNNYSSIKCFGLITGIDQINHVFYISIGTNTFLNIVIQSLFWIFLISFIKKKESYIFSFKIAISILVVSCLAVSTIYIEERFYLKSLYFFDFESFEYFLQLWLLLLFLCSVSSYFLLTRKTLLTKFLPFMYILMGVFSGLNFNFFTIGISVLGLFRILKNKKFWINKYYLFFLLFIWVNNAYTKEYFVDPDKLRGFTSSIFTSASVLIYGVIFSFLINGLIYIFDNVNKLYLEDYLKNSMICGLLIMLFGYLGSSMPLFNFLNYYFLGLNKYGINRSSIFELNQWGERVAWRGNFPSAETIGEFFALNILIFSILYFKKKINFNLLYLFLLLVSLIGLLSSNNRAALLSLFICLFIAALKENYNFKYLKYFMSIFLIVIFVLLIGLNNFTYSLSYLQDSLVSDGLVYSSGENISSSLEFVNFQKENGSPAYFFVGLISIFGFFVNRSELWGIFLARYNPNLQELLFGSGVNNFGQFYGDMYINPTYSFLLPHSSLLSYLIFFGIVNITLLICFLFIKNLYKLRRDSYLFLYLMLFVFLNILKSDSMLYFPSFVNYLFIIYFANKKNMSLV